MSTLSPAHNAYFDAAVVARAIRFVECLTLTKSTRSRAPEPFVLLQHSKRVIANLYGWRRADGRRLYRKCFLTMARKQAKTQTAAAIVCIEFFLGDEPKQEIYFAATDTDQAAICYGAVIDMINASAELSEVCDITPSRRQIVHKETGSIIRVLSADGKKKHGFNPSLVVFDELHAFGPVEQELHDALTTGSKSRPEPLWINTTTAGNDRETICGREYEYAKRILAGEVEDPTYFPAIYEVPVEADWTDRSLWPLALPLLKTGHHTLEDYEEEFQKALAQPSEQNKFRRLYLNQWTSAETQWIPIRTWDGCRGEIDESVLTALPCWGGLDLGATNDLTAFAICWPLPDGRVAIRVWAYAPKETLADRQRRDGKPYQHWADRGWLRLTAGKTTDEEDVFEHILELSRSYQLRGVAYDRWHAKYLEKRFTQSHIACFEWGQGYKDMAPAIRAFEMLVFEGKLVQDGNEALRWNMDCCQVINDPAGNKKLVKPPTHINSRHIDMTVAAVMAVGAAKVCDHTVDPYSNGARLIAA